MFSAEKWSGKKQDAGASQEVGPKQTDEAVIEYLEERTRAALARVPELEATLTPKDIHMVANSMAVMQEKNTGMPFTLETIEAMDSQKLEDELVASLEGRVQARPAATAEDAYMVINRDGSVIGRADTIDGAAAMNAEQRENEDRRSL